MSVDQLILDEERASARGVIAIEGVSLVGKSTLVERLREALPDARYFPCYVEGLKQDRVPAFDPGSSAGQLEAFETFMAVESSRYRQLVNKTKLAVLDRSVDTLIAHAHALDAICGYRSELEVRRRLRSRNWIQPDVTVMLRADLHQLAIRRKARPSLPPGYSDSAYVDLFEEHFASTPVTRRVIQIDCGEPADTTLRRIIGIIGSKEH